MLPSTNESSTAASALASKDAISVSAFEERTVRLFDEMRVPLLRYLRAFPLALPDAEDVIQEAFLGLFQELRLGKSHHNVRGWLFRVAHNLALKKGSRLRSEAGAPESLAPAEEFLIDPALNPEDQFALVQRQKCLMSVARALPERHRWCLYLRAEGLRYREIAKILDMSLGAVAISLGRSLEHLARAAER